MQNNNDFLNPAEFLNPDPGIPTPPPAVGPQGTPGGNGSNGANGSAGISAFCQLVSTFTVPNDGSSFQITVQPYNNGGVPCTAPFNPGMNIYVGQTVFQVDSVDSNTLMTIHLVAGISGNIINSGASVTPAGAFQARQPGTVITKTIGDTTASTIPQGAAKVIFTRPTAAATGPDLFLPDAKGMTDLTIKVYNCNASGRTITVGPSSLTLLNESTSVYISIPVGTSNGFWSDGTQWFTV